MAATLLSRAATAPMRQLAATRPMARPSFAPALGRVQRCSVKLMATAASYDSEEVGTKGTLEYRIFFKSGSKALQPDKPVSPWHEVPLWAGENVVNFICEIPKETKAKMEVATDEHLTPIKQDTKKGKLRDYPYNINWNYGMVPQTWEDPAEAWDSESMAGILGDNDPIDLVEIGSTQLKMGGVYAVKPLGAYAMIDDGELDWKILGISVDDPKADLVNDVEDVEREFPGELQKILEWFRDYKIPDGKGANKFGFDNKALNKEYALHVIEEAHGAYVKLKSGKRANSEELSLI